MEQTHSAPSSLTPVFRLLFLEGAFAMAYDTWLGPTYMSGVAGELGVSIGWVSLLLAVPWIGSMGQIFGLWAYQKWPSPKRYTVVSAGIARVLWLAPMLLSFYWAYLAKHSQQAFPVHRFIVFLAVSACCSAVLATSSGASWLSWIQAIVPAKFRGRFLGTRQRWVMAAVIAANLIGTTCVGWSMKGYRVGYGLLAVGAMFCAALSTALLARVPAPPARTDVVDLKGRLEKKTLRELVMEPLRNPEFRKVLIFGAMFNGAIQLSGSYFPYFFTKELHIPMTQIAFWAVLSNIGWFAASSLWGRYLDRTGNSRRVLWVTAHLIAMSPLPYVFPGAALTQLIAPFEYFLNGAIWSGFAIALMTLQMETASEKRNTVYFSVYTACAGLMGVAGSFLGGYLATLFTPWGGFRALWLVSSIVRFSVVWIFFCSIASRRSLRRRAPIAAVLAARA